MRMTRIIGTLIVLAAPVSAFAAPDAPAAASGIAAVFAEYAGPDRPGCTVGVMQGGRLVHASAYGLADLETRSTLVPDSVFNLASVSKQFTAFALLLLEDRGRLSLEDKLVVHVPELRESAGEVTLRQLVHHTGGLRDYAGLLAFRGRSESEGATGHETLVALARQRHADRDPGTAFDYSNTGYFLLGVVIERVSGQSLARFSEENIFRPLGMTSTRIVDRYPAGIGLLARAYAPRGDGFVVDESAWEQTGDGQVHSNLHDLALWDENFYTARVGGRTVVERMTETGLLGSGERLDYAAGLRIASWRGLATVSHGGAWAGYRSHLLRFPDRHISVAVLCNRGDAATGTLAQRVATLCLGDAVGPEPAASEGLAAIDALPAAVAPAQMPAGAYRDGSTGSYLFLHQAADGPQLSAFGGVVELEPAGRQAQRLRGWTEGFAGFQRPADAPAKIVIRYREDRFEYVLAAPWSDVALSRYAGAYDGDEANARCVLDERAGRLFLESCAKGVELIPAAPGEFASTDGLFSLRFPDGGAVSDRFAFHGFGLRGLEFGRVVEAAP